MGASKQFKEVSRYNGYVDTSSVNAKPNYKGQGYVKKNNQNGKKPFNKNGNFKKPFKPKQPIQAYRHNKSNREAGKDYARERVDLDTFVKRCIDGKFVFKVFKYKKYDNFENNEVQSQRYFPSYIALHKHEGNFYMFNVNRKLTAENVSQAVKVKSIFEYKDGNIYINTNTGYGYTAEPFLSPKQFKRYYGM